MSSARSNANPVSNLEEKIRLRAYELYQQRGGEHGRDFDDWLQAESDILQQKLGPTPVRPTALRATPAKRVPARRSSH